MALHTRVNARSGARNPCAMKHLTFIVACTLLRATVAAGSTGSDLSRRQIVGLVLGLGGGTLVLLAACLCCCFYLSPRLRRRQTGDLSWVKTADLEAAEVAYTAQAGDPSSPGGQSEQQDGGSGGGGGKPILPVAVAACEGPTAVESAAVAPMHDNPGPGPVKKQNAHGSGGVAHFLLRRKAGSGIDMPRLSTAKDKNLQVSRSTRVEPSAELEMSTPFEPTATNHGPPLSKSSMLLRWLHSAEDGQADTVAAQLAAAAAAVVGGGASGAGSGNKGSAPDSGRGGGGTGAGLHLFSDRLPLLSLAAQQTGIVFSKMPPSVASSPAVSVTEGSMMSRHMLKGTLRRSDAPDDSAYGQGGSPPGGNPLDGGDHRYPASLSTARMDSIGIRPQQRPGIVFDHVPLTSPNVSRAGTLHGGLVSRGPTFGGAVLPMPPFAGAVSAALATAASSAAAAPQPAGTAEQSASRLDAATVTSVSGESPPAQLSKGAWSQAGALRTSAFAQAAQDVEQHGGDQARGQEGQSSLWLHQVPPTRLTSLREADEEAEAPPMALLSQSSSKQLVFSPLPLMASLPPVSEHPALNPVASLTETWIRFSSDDNTGLPVASAPQATADASHSTAAAVAGLSCPSLPDAAAPTTLAPPLLVPTVARCVSQSQPIPLGSRAVQGDGDGLPVVSIGGGLVPILPSEEGLPPLAPATHEEPSGAAAAAQLLALRRRAALPEPMRGLQPSRSGSSMRSTTSISPSLPVHFPAYEVQEAAKYAAGTQGRPGVFMRPDSPEEGERFETGGAPPSPSSAHGVRW